VPDRWRDQVLRITELSVDLHRALDGCAGDSDPDPDVAADAIDRARQRLTDIEQAMHRLDERTYGRCLDCLMPIPLADLVDQPEARYCLDCGRTATAAPRTPRAPAQERVRTCRRPV
jgi:hypothetical protein